MQQDEIVFLLIPHIVRESVITEANRRAFDTGTSLATELRRDENPQPRYTSSNFAEGTARYAVTGPQTTAAGAAEAARQQMAAAGRPVPQSGFAATNAGLNTADGAAAAMIGQPNQPVPPSKSAANALAPAPLSLAVTPGSSNQAPGSTFQVAIMLDHGTNVFQVPMQVQYNPNVLELVNVDAGEFLQKDGKPVSLVHRVEGNGLAQITASRPPSSNGVSGQGNLCTLTFRALAAGDSKVTLVKVGAQDSLMNNLPATGSEAVVHVK